MIVILTGSSAIWVVEKVEDGFMIIHNEDTYKTVNFEEVEAIGVR